MQDSKKSNGSTNSNNSKNNLIGLTIFVGMFILIVIVIVIFTKSILPTSGSSASSMLVADSNLGIHTDTTTEPVTVKTNKNASSRDKDYENNNDVNEQGTVMTVSSSVNVRTGPGSSYTQIGELAAGREVTVYENVNGWYRISFNGSTDAYVYSGYISGSLPQTTSSSSSYYNGYSENTATYTSYAQYNQNNNFNNDGGNGYNYN